MKIIKLLLLTILFVSCEAEDSITSNECECIKYTEVRVILYDDNNNVLNDTGYQENGATEFYSNDCEDDNKIIGGHTGQFPNQIVMFRYNVKCN